MAEVGGPFRNPMGVKTSVCRAGRASALSASGPNWLHMFFLQLSV